MTVETSPDFTRSLFINYFMNEAERRLTFRLFKLSLIEVKHNHALAEHLHHFYEIVIPIKADYHCNLNNRKLTVSPCNALLVHAGDLHSDHYISGSELLFIQFYIDDMFGSPWNHGIIDKTLPPDRHIIELPEKDEIGTLIGLAINHRRNNANRLLAVGKLCEAIIRDLIGLIPENLLGKEYSNTIENDEFIRDIENYYYSKIHKKLDIKALCRHLGMCRRAVEKKFAEVFHSSPQNMFLKLKIKRAKDLLDSGKSIKETADILGFSDQFYFSTVFKRITGSSPSRYQGTNTPLFLNNTTPFL